MSSFMSCPQLILPFLILSIHVLVSTSLIGTAHARCTEQHHNSLLLVKNQLRFPNNSKLASWDSGTDCCSWEGVSCDESSQVITIDISFSQVSGEIHSALFNITSLQRLDLSNNVFLLLQSGIGISATSKLRQLYMYNCSLSGLAPIWLFNHPTLQELYLGRNNISSFPEDIPHVGSSKLEVLDLAYNRLYGTIPTWLFKLSHLRRVYLGHNKLVGSIDLSSYNHLVNLTDLELSYNLLTLGSNQDKQLVSKFSSLGLASLNLTKIPEFLRHQEKIITLDLSHNSITGLIPSWLWHSVDMSNMDLDLSYNRLTGYEPLPVQNLSHASEVEYGCNIHLASNHFTGLIPLPSCNFAMLDYCINNFGYSIPANIGEYVKKAESIILSTNNLVGEIPSSLCNATLIRILDLAHNHLSGHLPACLVNNRFLEVLELQGNKFSGKIPPDFKAGCELKSINVNGNMLEGELPTSLTNCNSLWRIDVGNNQIGGQFPFWMDKLRSLRFLMLENNEFTGSLTHSWNNTFQSLQVMDLSANHFKGRLPNQLLMNLEAMKNFSEFSSFKIFKYLYVNRSVEYKQYVTITNKNSIMDIYGVSSETTSFDLSFNEFEGIVPASIGDLVLLKTLNLSHNNLIGPIPQSLGKLRQLESLDLSFNKMSGEIPTEVASLTFLSVLNLSYNFLTGRIPQGGQFNTFNISSYMGNQGLCGAPLVQICGQDERNMQNHFILGKKGHKVDWHLMSLELGFISGLMFSIGFFILWPTGSRYFNDYVYNFKDLAGMCIMRQ